MKPVRQLFDGWVHSPQRVLGLFPDWFAPPQPDWPAQTRLTGFPLQDGRRDDALGDDVRAFLDAGEPPIVFTPGSAMAQGLSFFTESLEACRQLGRRGMFVTQFRESIPDKLPETVRHFHYVPYGRCCPMPRRQSITAASALRRRRLAAGVPQLGHAPSPTISRTTLRD